MSISRDTRINADMSAKVVDGSARRNAPASPYPTILLDIYYIYLLYIYTYISKLSNIIFIQTVNFCSFLGYKLPVRFVGA